MIVRIASVDLVSFLLCYKHKLWGANTTYVSKWRPGDKLVFKVNNELLAIATVIDQAYMDDKVIWENGLFWHRVPLEFDKVLLPSEGILFEPELKQIFIGKWGKKYGWVILNKTPLPDDLGLKILNQFEKEKDATKTYEEKIDNMIKSAKSGVKQ